jgi:hypothetical protein
MLTYEEACEQVRRFGQSVCRKELTVCSSVEFDTHWIITYGIKSLENPNKFFRYGRLIFEKKTGDIYYAQSRSRCPITLDNFPANSSDLVRATADDINWLEVEDDRE